MKFDILEFLSGSLIKKKKKKDEFLFYKLEK